jgi:hypothetical protein
VTAAAQEARALLRHTLATVAYRGAKVLRGAPAGFAAFKLGPGTRTPVEILGHLADLFAWATHLAEGRHVWKPASSGVWETEAARFFRELQRLDAVLASDRPLEPHDLERLFQGPIADALTHIGQLALLRRRAGAPVRGENYFQAEIRTGAVGPEQAASKVEFE